MYQQFKQHQEYQQYQQLIDNLQSSISHELQAEAKAIERSFERYCAGRDIHDIKIYDLDPFITFVTRFFGRPAG